MTFIRSRGWGVGSPAQFWVDGREHLIAPMLEMLAPDWWHNWSEFLFYSDTYPRFIPTVWNGRYLIDDSDAGQAARRQLAATIANHPAHEWLLLNEPNRDEQANLSPAEAFAITQAFIRLAWDTGVEGQYLAPGVELSVSGIEWATEYAKLCRIHFLHRPAALHVHCYNCLTTAQWTAMWQRFEKWYAVWGGSAPYVISEISADNRPLDDQKRVMDRVRERMDTDSGLLGVAWYSANTCPGNPFPNSRLVDYDPVTDSIALNDLGKHWISLK